MDIDGQEPTRANVRTATAENGAETDTQTQALQAEIRGLKDENAELRSALADMQGKFMAELQRMHEELQAAHGKNDAAQNLGTEIGKPALDLGIEAEGPVLNSAATAEGRAQNLGTENSVLDFGAENSALDLGTEAEDLTLENAIAATNGTMTDAMSTMNMAPNDGQNANEPAASSEGIGSFGNGENKTEKTLEDYARELWGEEPGADDFVAKTGADKPADNAEPGTKAEAETAPDEELAESADELAQPDSDALRQQEEQDEQAAEKRRAKEVLKECRDELDKVRYEFAGDSTELVRAMSDAEETLETVARGLSQGRGYSAEQLWDLRTKVEKTLSLSERMQEGSQKFNKLLTEYDQCAGSRVRQLDEDEFKREGEYLQCNYDYSQNISRTSRAVEDDAEALRRKCMTLLTEIQQQDRGYNGPDHVRYGAYALRESYEPSDAMAERFDIGAEPWRRDADAWT